MDYYQKYLKYKRKYSLIKNQIGGEPIDNYFTTFFGITNDETMRSPLRVSLTALAAPPRKASPR